MTKPKYSVGEVKWIVIKERYYAPMRDMYWVAEAELTACVLPVLDSLFPSEQEKSWRYVFAYGEHKVFDNQIFDSYEDAYRGFEEIRAKQIKEDEEKRLAFIESEEYEKLNPKLYKKKRWWE
jgi:hypothetical protein